jgi:hypothetical protein
MIEERQAFPFRERVIGASLPLFSGLILGKQVADDAQGRGREPIRM